MISRSCPKCGGNLLLEREPEGMIIKCFQCGWMPYMGKDNSLLVQERNKHNGNYAIGWRFKRKTLEMLI